MFSGHSKSILNSQSGRFAFALVLFGLTLACRFAFLPVEDGQAFLTFYPGLTIAFLLCGNGPGAAYTVLSAAAGFYIFVPPHWSWEPNWPGVITTGIYFISAALIAGLTHRMNRAFEESERNRDFANHLYTFTPAMLHSIDAKGRLIKVSDYWLKTLGYERHEVLGLPTSDFLTQESRDFAKNIVLPRFFETGVCSNVPYQMVCKDGRILDVLLSASLERDKQGQPLHSLASIVDVTDTKKTERALASSEARYKALVEDQTELVSLSDLDGVLHFVNEAYAKHYGSTAVELVGGNLYDFIPERERQDVNAQIAKVFRSSEPSVSVNSTVSVTAGTRWVAWTNRVVTDTDGVGLLLHSVGRDVTEQRANDLALRQSKAELQLVSDSLPGLVSNIDCDLRYIFANRAYAEWFGIDPQTLRGVSLKEFYGDAVFNGISDKLHAALSGETVVSEREVVTGGKLRHCHVVNIPQRNESNKVIGLFAIHTDITDRKQAERQLESERQKMQDILDGTEAGTWSWNIETGEVDFNERWAIILGKSLSELRPLSIKTWIDHVHPEDLPVAQKALDRHYSGETPSYECEIRMHHKNGGWVWVLARGRVVLRDNGGRAMRISGIHLDVSARHEAVEAANRASRHLQNTLDAVPSLVGYWDVNLINRFANKAYSNYFGLKPNNILGHHISEVLGTEIYQKNLPFIQAALQGEEQNFERLIPSTEGQPTKHTIAKYLPEIVDGVVQGFYVFVVDVTAIAEAQRTLSEVNIRLEQRTLEAEMGSASKGQFLANMSHEIRTPMNAILGLLNLLQTTELTPRQRDYANKTEGAAKSLLSLINDILDFSKVEAGKMTLESEPFRIDRSLRNLSVMLSAIVGNKNIEVLFDIAPDLPAVVKGDAMRLQQVLINLGSNAVKFTSKGQVVLALRKLAQIKDSVTIEFSVQDTGIGIAPEHQAHIFSGFSQAEGSTTRRFGGTGLGLAISKRLVEMMGGNIQIRSNPGEGSTFTFVLELPIVPIVPPELAVSELPAMPALRVLVVDDNSIAGELTLRMVRSWGWSADLAVSGTQALDIVSSQLAANPAVFPYPVIYVDWQLSDMDGWDVTRHIRQLAHQRHLAQPTVIMVATHGREILAQRTLEEQNILNGFLVKPVTASMLYEALLEAGSGNSGLRVQAKGRSNARQLRGMRILVAEDNLINQQVADELLSAEGAIVSLAANGQIAVDAVAAAAPQFDVVLMDVQMPVLDGYGATKAIRDDLGLSRLPIIAMTANAMASDRDACLAAGMNEHVGKPFDIAKLVSLLIRITEFQSDAGPELAPFEGVHLDLPKVVGLDIQTALDRMSGMRGLYVRTARDFVKIMDTIVPELERCLKAGDRQFALMRLHTLKGNAGTLGATDLASMAAKLEVMCKSDAGMSECAQGLQDFSILVHSTQQKLSEAITRMEQASTETSLPAFDARLKANALDALREVAVLAAASDMEALMRFAEVREILSILPGDFTDRLDQALQDIDLETANVICEEMLSESLSLSKNSF